MSPLHAFHDLAIRFINCPFSLSLFSPSADGKAVYGVFLKSEFCEENIEFWTACEDFRTSKSKREMALRAKQIAEEFVKSNAPKEVITH